MQRVKVIIYDAQLNRFLNTNSSDKKDLWKYIERRKKLALLAAKKQVGVKTGALKKNISAYHLGNFTGQYAGLRADLMYAYSHHEGTRPHIINPRGSNKLVFMGRSGVVMVSQVRHPGTKANRYLSDQLSIFVGKKGGA